jgi:hypothetical protein
MNGIVDWSRIVRRQSSRILAGFEEAGRAEFSEYGEFCGRTRGTRVTRCNKTT